MINQHFWAKNFSLWKFSVSYSTQCKIWQLLIVSNVKFFLAVHVLPICSFYVMAYCCFDCFLRGCLLSPVSETITWFALLFYFLGTIAKVLQSCKESLRLAFLLYKYLICNQCIVYIYNKWGLESCVLCQQ